MTNLYDCFGDDLAKDARRHLIVLAENYETDTHIVVPENPEHEEEIAFYKADGNILATDIAIVSMSGERMLAYVEKLDDTGKHRVNVIPIDGFHFTIVESPEFIEAREQRLAAYRKISNAKLDGENTVGDGDGL